MRSSPTANQESAQLELLLAEPKPEPQPACVLKGLLDGNLNFHGADSEPSPHVWHPFPAKFPPQLPRFFIHELSTSGDAVLDPMCGSGTTLFEARRLGRQAVGCDIDPLARMVSSAKLSRLDPKKTYEAGVNVLEQAKADFEFDQPGIRTALRERFDEKTNKFVNYWFLPDHQLELLTLARYIEVESDDEIREFLKVVFSSTINAKSGGVSLARDLAHTRPHRDVNKIPPSAFIEFERRLERNIAAIGDLSSPDGKSGSGLSASTVLAASAGNTGLPSDSIDLVITSPPYANNAIDYMRAHKFSLVWLGWPIEDLSRIRSGYIGHEAGIATDLDHLPDQCQRTVKCLSERDARKAGALARYFSEMYITLGEMYRVLKRSRAAVLVVGSSVLRGIDVKTHLGLSALGNSCGFEVAGIGSRQLDRDRRMMPARRGTGTGSQIERRMYEEYVIGLVKS